MYMDVLLCETIPYSHAVGNILNNTGMQLVLHIAIPAPGIAADVVEFQDHASMED